LPSTLLQTLALASTGLLSAGSITLVILLLLSERGWRNGLGYALGYTGAYSLIGVTAVLVGYRTSVNNAGKPGYFLPILVLLLGALLLWLSLRNWRKPIEDDPQTPRFFEIVDRVTPTKSFGFGAMVTVVNFKNLALFLSAQSVVILGDIPITEKVLISLLASLVFCLSVMIPVLIYLAFPRRAGDVLNGIKLSLSKHSRAIGIWLPLIFGLLLIAKGMMDLR